MTGQPSVFEPPAHIIGNDEMGLTIADRHAKKFRAVLADALEEAAAAG